MDTTPLSSAQNVADISEEHTDSSFSPELGPPNDRPILIMCFIFTQGEGEREKERERESSVPLESTSDWLPDTFSYTESQC
jgi:hypothetical protein